MSKIGQKPVTVSGVVQVELKDNTFVARGSKGEVTLTLPPTITLTQEGETLTVQRSNDNKKVKSSHGLYRSLIANAVHGVEKGWQKRLEVVGTGYNVKMQGADLNFKVGYSHPVIFKPVAGIQFAVEGNNKVIVSGVDKQLVGQIAHQIKMLKKPDVYKGKGIRYEGEVIKLKAGKKAKA